MSYFQGNIEMVSGVTLGNALGKLVRGAVTGEQMAQPEYSGTGLLVLEPSFKHFLVLELAANESIIVDDGMFYCAQGSVSVKVISQRNLSSAVAGGESFFQQQLTGPGIVILESTVPMSEVDIIDLENDTLKVDGQFCCFTFFYVRFYRRTQCQDSDGFRCQRRRSRQCISWYRSGLVSTDDQGLRYTRSGTDAWSFQYEEHEYEYQSF